MSDYLKHYGVLGMKWGVRRYQNSDGTLTPAGKKRYQATSSDSAITKKVKKDLVSLSGSEFRKKYGVSNTTYMKRVDRYGDPYMNAPLAKIGKSLEKRAQTNVNRYSKKEMKKNVKEMSDDELRRVVNRLQMERQYSQLSGSSVNKGKEYAQKIIKAGTTVASVTGTALTIYNNADKIKAILEKKR